MKSLLYSTLLLSLTATAAVIELEPAPDPQALPAPRSVLSARSSDSIDADDVQSLVENDHAQRKQAVDRDHTPDQEDREGSAADSENAEATQDLRYPNRANVIVDTTPPDAADDAEVAELPTTMTCGLADFRDELMYRVNQARASTRMCGPVIYPAAAPVQWNARLFDVAAFHSAEMSSLDYFSHTGADGSSVADRLADAGYRWSTYGENLAAGQASIEQLIDDLLSSPKHCAIVMKQSLTQIGAACASDDNSTYKMYWSMNFGRPATPTSEAD